MEWLAEREDKQPWLCALDAPGAAEDKEVDVEDKVLNLDEVL
jgi:hypothetical protein